MKRVLAFILIVQLLIVSVYAADSLSATVSASAVSGRAGETVEVTISIHSNPGYTNYAILLDYDREALTLQAITPAETEDGPLFSANCDYRAVDAKSYGFVTAAGETEQTGDGTLFTASFLIAENFSGEAHVTPIVQYIRNNAADYSLFIDIATAVQPGSIRLESAETPTIPGDLDGDGVVKLPEVAQILKAYKDPKQLADSMHAVDQNGDGVLSLSEVALVLKNYKT